MQLGRLFGMLFMVLGAPLMYMLYDTVKSGDYVMRFMIAGPPFFLIGLAMLIFPGGNITNQESKQGLKDPKTVFNEAPTSHKVIWVAAGVIGFVTTMIYIG